MTTNLNDVYRCSTWFFGAFLRTGERSVVEIEQNVKFRVDERAINLYDIEQLMSPRHFVNNT